MKLVWVITIFYFKKPYQPNYNLTIIEYNNLQFVITPITIIQEIISLFLKDNVNNHNTRQTVNHKIHQIATKQIIHKCRFWTIINENTIEIHFQNMGNQLWNIQRTLSIQLARQTWAQTVWSFATMKNATPRNTFLVILFSKDG